MPKITADELWALTRERIRLENERLDNDPEVQARRKKVAEEWEALIDKEIAEGVRDEYGNRIEPEEDEEDEEPDEEGDE